MVRSGYIMKLSVGMGLSNTADKVNPVLLSAERPSVEGPYLVRLAVRKIVNYPHIVDNLKKEKSSKKERNSATTTACPTTGGVTYNCTIDYLSLIVVFG